MNDEIGDMPQPTDEQHALREILKIAQDRRGHLMLTDHCRWLELKLKAVALMADRGLQLGNPHPGQRRRQPIKDKLNCALCMCIVLMLVAMAGYVIWRAL